MQGILVLLFAIVGVASGIVVFVGAGWKFNDAKNLHSEFDTLAKMERSPPPPPSLPEASSSSRRRLRQVLDSR